MQEPVVITAAKRTPMGGMGGNLSSLSAPQLGACAIKSVVGASGLNPALVDEIYMGNVVSAGARQAPARQASIYAGLPEHIPCTTINKVCGSGMKAAMLGCDQILAGHAEFIIAGGMESMSNTPYLIPKARAGLRLGHGELCDSLFLDGLEDACTANLMGVFAQQTADQYRLSREAMDAFATGSLSRAKSAIEAQLFDKEISPVAVKTSAGENLIREDEQPGTANPDKIPRLRPAFKKDGTVTAANSSSMSDGAAALLMARESAAQQQGQHVLAHMVAQATHAQAPSEFCIAPVEAINKVVKKAGWGLGQVDLFEINEAFGLVTMLAIDKLNLDASRVNVHGGACALGHPLGATGARLLVTLIHALEHYGKKRGVAALCIGGGEATAIAIERP